jgi:hypothetical protein
MEERMSKKIEINLSPTKRQELKCFVTKGSHPARLIRRAQIVLALDSSDGRRATTAEQVALACNVS